VGDGSAEDAGALREPGGAGAAGSGPATEEAAAAPLCDAAIGGCGCGAASATGGAWLHVAASRWNESLSKSPAAPLACAASAAGESEAASSPCTALETFVFEIGGAMQAAGGGGAADAAHRAAWLPADSVRPPSDDFHARLRAQMFEDV
jgi:hypothetical protein